MTQLNENDCSTTVLNRMLDPSRNFLEGNVNTTYQNIFVITYQAAILAQFKLQR